MPSFVALLRGVNVGTAKRVPMAELRSVLSRAGYRRVATLLNSGNAVFDAPEGTPADHAAAIADALARKFTFEVPVVVKSARELGVIIRENTIVSDEMEHARLLAIFAQSAARLATLKSIALLVAPPERFLHGQHAGYLYCARGILESKAASALLGKAGAAVTTRNWATVLKLQALVVSPDR